MAEHREACDNRIYLLTSKVIYLFITNIWFLVSILPFILYFFISGENLSIPILTFSGILVGPALSTMFSVTGKLINDKQEGATKDYFNLYKINFAQGIFIAAIINVILMICYIDIGYFYASNMKIISYIFIILAIFIGGLSFYIYPIVGRINARTLDIFKVSITLVFKKLYITLTNISLIIIGVAIVNFTNISLIAVLFGASALCYSILRMEDKILNEVDVYFKEKYSDL
ncbi:YesL family protein [Clostridium sp. D53t1_180928_C8]|uniref:YesL family protein n=1 Tax=Clostridium sp. D53t1_180928_C8 TaxID=2787101 RepID=UPI0018AC255A|nr:YesL family protein [Clostridium sp. D53t1_180928_C8]